MLRRRWTGAVGGTWGSKHRLRALLPTTIAPGRLAVFFPTLLQQLDFGFWCDPEPSKSKDGCAHRNARCALDHRTSTAGIQHRCCSRRDVARVANVPKHAVQPFAESDQVVLGHLGSPSRAQRLNHFREPRPLSITRWHQMPSRGP